MLRSDWLLSIPTFFITLEWTVDRIVSFLCRTNFPLDLLCSFPTDIIVFAIWPDSLGKLNIFNFRRNLALFTDIDIDIYVIYRSQGNVSLFLIINIFLSCCRRSSHSIVGSPQQMLTHLQNCKFATVFVDTRLWKTKQPRNRFQNFRQPCVLSIDRTEIHQSQPLMPPSDLLYVMLAGCDWCISI